MSWTNEVKWNEMKTGKNCPFCNDIHLDENDFSYKIAEFPNSYVRLPKNQFWKGWTIVALKRHANELFELSDQELSEFWKEVSVVAKVVNDVYQPVKINYAVYGNLCPHVHCHIFPQQYENDPHAPIDQEAEKVLLSPGEYQEIIFKLRKSLEQ